MVSLFKRRESSRNSFNYANPNYQWRARDLPRLSPRHDSSETSRTRRPPLERTFEVAPPPPPPIPTNDQIMGDLRDVTLQYVSCADPTESAARKRRVIQGEEKGLMAATTSIMLEAAIISNQNYLASDEIPTKANTSESQDVPSHPTDQATNSNVPVKKKRGRPPLVKSQNKAVVPLLGAKSSKRHKGLVQNSLKRKSTPDKNGAHLQEAVGPSRTIKAKQKLNLQPGVSNPSTNLPSPTVNIIPARVKDKVDFHHPPNQIP